MLLGHENRQSQKGYWKSVTNSFFPSCSVGKSRGFISSVVHFPVKASASFIFINQHQRLFQSYVPWVEKLPDTPSWYIPAQQMPDREHLSCLPEEKIIENFCLHSFFSLLYFPNPILKTSSENIKNLQIRSYFISKQDLLSFFCSPDVPHTIK